VPCEPVPITATRLVGHFEGVADRAVAKQARREGLGVERVIHVCRAIVDDARRHQDRAGAELARFCDDPKAFVFALDLRDTGELALGAVPFGLLGHARKQFGA
jgi:hypothetical protein